VELDRAVRSRNDSEMKRAEINERFDDLSQTLDDTRGRYRECAQTVSNKFSMKILYSWDVLKLTYLFGNT